MRNNNRVSERFGVHRSATLISPSQKKITATIANVSLNGLLLFDLSSPVDESTLYKVEILAANNHSIFLSGIPAWKDKDHVGIKITRYHFDSREILKSFINDLNPAPEYSDLPDADWLT